MPTCKVKDRHALRQQMDSSRGPVESGHFLHIKVRLEGVMPLLYASFFSNYFPHRHFCPIEISRLEFSSPLPSPRDLILPVAFLSFATSLPTRRPPLLSPSDLPPSTLQMSSCQCEYSRFKRLAWPEFQLQCNCASIAFTDWKFERAWWLIRNSCRPLRLRTVSARPCRVV